MVRTFTTYHNFNIQWTSQSVKVHTYILEAVHWSESSQSSYKYNSVVTHNHVWDLVDLHTYIRVFDWLSTLNLGSGWMRSNFTYVCVTALPFITDSYLHVTYLYLSGMCMHVCMYLCVCMSTSTRHNNTTIQIIIVLCTWLPVTVIQFQRGFTQTSYCMHVQEDAYIHCNGTRRSIGQAYVCMCMYLDINIILTYMHFLMISCCCHGTPWKLWYHGNQCCCC